MQFLSTNTYLRAETDKWGKVVRAAGIVPQ